MALLHAMLMLPVEHHRRCLWLPTLLSVLLSADFFWTTLRGRLDLFLIRSSQPYGRPGQPQATARAGCAFPAKIVLRMFRISRHCPDLLQLAVADSGHED
jgi:hypothetical protein